MAIQKLPFTFADLATGWRRIAETINQIIDIVSNLGSVIGVAAAGVYEAPFLSGSIQFNDNGALGGGGDFQFGRLLPNASGTPCIGILLGGAGATQCVYITDEQIPGSKGINVIREAGDASASGAANWDGGDLLDFGGGTLNGQGGQAKYQGGTSVTGRAGDAVLHGGNTTSGTPGNAVCIGGETGPTGGSVLLIMTKPPGASGYGSVDVHANSTVLLQFLSNGEIYLTSSGTGAGLAGQALVSGGVGAPATWKTGFTGVITTAKLTGGGANGSMTFASGILTAQTAAT